jgi:hypothetical protein
MPRKPTRLFFMLVFLIVIAFALCSWAQTKTKSRTLKPWNGTWIGSATIVGKCEDGTQKFVETGVGLVEQMGKTTWSDTYCMDPTTWIASGKDAVITAENGDKVFLKITLLFTWTSQTSGNWTEAETIIGGTGRYAAATGDSHSRGNFTLTSPTSAQWEGVTTGLISY